jgi:hypothetical protein
MLNVAGTCFGNRGVIAVGGMLVLLLLLLLLLLDQAGCLLNRLGCSKHAWCNQLR